jgi:hypothetical protein
LEEAGYDLGDADTPHAAKVVLKLLQPWLKDEGTQRLLCADLYFASVPNAQELKARGIDFIGVIKTATRNFPMQFLGSRITDGSRGAMNYLCSVDEDEKVELIAMMLCDWRYFIGNAKEVEKAEPIFCARWHQVKTDEVSLSEKVPLEIPQPQMSKTYCYICGTIDQLRIGALHPDPRLVEEGCSWHQRHDLHQCQKHPPGSCW